MPRCFSISIQSEVAWRAALRAFDLVLYVMAEETLLTRGRIFLDWNRLTGGMFGAMIRPWHEVPTALISFGYPYYLYDAPRLTLLYPHPPGLGGEDKVHGRYSITGHGTVLETATIDVANSTNMLGRLRRLILSEEPMALELLG